MFTAIFIFVLCNMVFFALHLTDTSSFAPPLSQKEERELFLRMKKGDQKAREKLCEHNLRLVAHVCKKYYSDGRTTPDDLISIGTIGLIKAIDTFDIDKGKKFSTYGARCIENEILMHFRKLKKSECEVSLSDSFEGDGSENDLTYSDIASDPAVFDEEIDNRLLQQDIDTALAKLLTPRERLIVILRYGLKGQRAHTQMQVAKHLGISRSYVSRIEKGALQKLRTHFETLQHV